MKFTAEDARSASKSASMKLLPSVYEAIKKAASKGEEKVFFYKLLSDSELAELKTDGYSVEQGTDRDGPLVTISWVQNNPLLQVPEKYRS